MVTGIGIGVGIQHAPRQGGSDLYRLFANGEDGFLFGNFGDLTRLFTTAAGLTQVANDADPVGLALDDSDWQRRTLAQQVAQASEAVRNTNMAGAAPGTPGTVPTNWQNLQVPSGCTAQIIAVTGDVLRVRLSGTPTSGGLAVKMEQNTQIVAAPSQVWRSSLEVALVAGSLANIAISVGWDECSAAGAYLASSYSAITPGGTLAAYPRQAALLNSGAARVVPTLIGGIVAGQPIDLTLDIRAPSMRLVAGNHGVQSTSGARPLYKPNSGKPYLQFDGSDDIIKTPFNPVATLTLAAAVRVTASASDQYVMGGGETASISRAYLGVQGTTNLARAVWGGTTLLGDADVTGADHVLIVTGNAATASLWVDGVKKSTVAPTGAPGGTTGPIGLGGINPNGTASTWFAGRGSAFLALNRAVTDAEIALITSKLRSTYQ